MTAVTQAPIKKALSGLLVTVSIARFRVPEELSFRPFPIILMPYRNIARPPNNVIKSNIFIKSFPSAFSVQLFPFAAALFP